MADSQWRDLVPGVHDRALMNIGLSRAVATLKAAPPRPGTLGSLKLLVIEAEIACANARIQERERCADLAAACAEERFRLPCGGLTEDWMEGFRAACEFISVAIKR